MSAGRSSGPFLQAELADPASTKPQLARNYARHHVLILAAVGLVALALRLSPLLGSGMSWAMDNDSPGYIELANGLMEGCGFARFVQGRCEGPEVSRTPGYPVFLAIMPSLRWSVAVQAVIGTFTCLVIALFAWKLWGVWAGLAAELLLAFNIPSIVVGAMILSDGLFVALVTAGVLLGFVVISRQLLDKRAIVLSLLGALLLGLAILVRPIGLLLPLFAPLPFLLLPNVNWRRRLGLSLTAFAIPALIMTGWAERNRQRTGIFTLSVIGVYNLYSYRAPGLLAYETHRPMEYEQKVLDKRLRLGPSARAASMSPTLYDQMRARSLAIIMNHPAAFAFITLRSIVWQAFAPDRAHLLTYVSVSQLPTSYSAPLAERLLTMLRSPILTVLIVMQLALVLLVWIGVGRAFWFMKRRPRRDRAIVFIAAAIALMFILLAAGPEAQARYRLPAIPFLALAAGLGWFPPKPYRELSSKTHAEQF